MFFPGFGSLQVTLGYKVGLYYIVINGGIPHISRVVTPITHLKGCFLRVITPFIAIGSGPP